MSGGLGLTGLTQGFFNQRADNSGLQSLVGAMLEKKRREEAMKLQRELASQQLASEEKVAAQKERLERDKMEMEAAKSGLRRETTVVRDDAARRIVETPQRVRESPLASGMILPGAAGAFFAQELGAAFNDPANQKVLNEAPGETQQEQWERMRQKAWGTTQSQWVRDPSLMDPEKPEPTGAPAKLINSYRARAQAQYPPPQKPPLMSSMESMIVALQPGSTATPEQKALAQRFVESNREQYEAAAADYRRQLDGYQGMLDTRVREIIDQDIRGGVQEAGLLKQWYDGTGVQSPATMPAQPRPQPHVQPTGTEDDDAEMSLGEPEYDFSDHTNDELDILEREYSTPSDVAPSGQPSPQMGAQPSPQMGFPTAPPSDSGFAPVSPQYPTQYLERVIQQLSQAPNPAQMMPNFSPMMAAPQAAPAQPEVDDPPAPSMTPDFSAGSPLMRPIGRTPLGGTTPKSAEEMLRLVDQALGDRFNPPPPIPGRTSKSADEMLRLVDEALGRPVAPTPAQPTQGGPPPGREVHAGIRPSDAQAARREMIEQGAQARTQGWEQMSGGVAELVDGIGRMFSEGHGYPEGVTRPPGEPMSAVGVPSNKERINKADDDIIAGAGSILSGLKRGVVDPVASVFSDSIGGLFGSGSARAESNEPEDEVDMPDERGFPLESELVTVPGTSARLVQPAATAFQRTLEDPSLTDQDREQLRRVASSTRTRDDQQRLLNEWNAMTADQREAVRRHGRRADVVPAAQRTSPGGIVFGGPPARVPDRAPRTGHLAGAALDLPIGLSEAAKAALRRNGFRRLEHDQVHWDFIGVGEGE